MLGRRKKRNDSWSKKTFSTLFYLMLSYLTDTHIDSTIANFGVYHRKVIQAILSMGDHVRFFPSMAAWVGFNKTTIDVEHAVRETGKSGYNLRSLLRLGLNVIISFSDKPLRQTVKFGLKDRLNHKTRCDFSSDSLSDFMTTRLKLLRVNYWENGSM